MDPVARSDYGSGAQPDQTCVSKILTFISSVMLMTRRIYAASCLQYTAEPDLEVSEKRLYPLLDQAVDAESDVALLPECALFLSSNQAASRANALVSDAPPILRLQRYAADHKITLIVVH